MTIFSRSLIVGSVVRLKGDYYQTGMTVTEVDEEKRTCVVVWLDPKRQPHVLEDCDWDIFHEVSRPTI